MKDQIELPPLPTINVMGKTMPQIWFTASEVDVLRRAAIEPYAKRIAELEAARISYASEFPAGADGEPVAFSYELATTRSGDGEYIHWSPRLSYSMPNVPDGSIRNLQWLYVAPQPAEPSGLVECGLCHNMRTLDPVEKQPAEPCVAPVSDKPVCGAQNEIQAPQVARSVDDSFDVDDYIAASIARGEFTKDEFLEARQWVRDTYYKPAEPVKVPSDESIIEFLGSVEAKTSDVYINGEWAYLDKLKFARALLDRYGQPVQTDDGTVESLSYIRGLEDGIKAAQTAARGLTTDGV